MRPFDERTNGSELMKNDARARSTAARLTRAEPPVYLTLALAGALAMAGTAAFYNSLRMAFVFDDEGHIVSAENIRNLWPVTTWLYGNPRPVVTLSLAINYALAHKDAQGRIDPYGFHVMNLGIHLCAAVVLFDLVRRTIVRISSSDVGLVRAAPWLAFSIALLWTVHPLQTQSVTYVIQRSESLMGLFFLLTLYFVVVAEGSQVKGAWYGLSILSCALGMACKATMIVAPAVVFLYDWFFLSRSPVKALRRRRWLYVGLVAAPLFVLWFTGLHSSLLSTDPGYDVTVGFALKEFTPLQYLFSQPGVLLHYLRLVVWPHPLCIDYEWPIPDLKDPGEFVLPSVLVAILLLATLAACWKKPWLGFIGLWFFIILAPSSSIVPVKDPAMEHRMYLPLAAAVAALVIGGYALLGRLLGHDWSGVSARRAIGALLVIAAAVALSVRTYYRNKDYAGPLAIWQSVLKFRPGNARAWVNYGESLTRYAEYEKAAEAFRRAIALRPNQHDAHYNLGNAYQSLGRLDDAEKAYHASLKISPNDLPSHIMLGNVYMTQERNGEAEAEFRTAIAAATRTTDRAILAKAHYNLGNTLAKRVRLDEAIEQYRKAVEVRPEYDKAHYALGWAMAGKDRFDEAQKHYTEAVRLNPQNFEARQALEDLPRFMESRQKILQELYPAPTADRAPARMVTSHPP
jgi:tetratricopeptide (TPR) repeat protein